MRDEHFYTRALSLTSSPERMIEYYIGRAEWYCIEYNYDKAYKDFLKAKELGGAIEDNRDYKTCLDFINADKNIEELTSKINNTPDDCSLYNLRAKLYFLKRKYPKALSDANKAIQISPCPDNYKVLGDLAKKIRERNVYDAIENSKKKDLIEAYKLRINLAKENVLKREKKDYWIKRAELDTDKIIELSKDKTLALLLKVNFYEYLLNFGAAIRNCKKLLEQSKTRTDKLGKTLTYIYAQKLVFLYANKEDFQEGIKVVLDYPDKPYSEDIKKAIEYIKKHTHIYIDILRKNCRTRIKIKKRNNNV